MHSEIVGHECPRFVRLMSVSAIFGTSHVLVHQSLVSPKKHLERRRHHELRLNNNYETLRGVIYR